MKDRTYRYDSPQQERNVRIVIEKHRKALLALSDTDIGAGPWDKFDDGIEGHCSLVPPSVADEIAAEIDNQVSESP